MHGTKPDPAVVPDEALSRLSIQSPPQRVEQPQSAAVQQEPAAQPRFKSEAEQRFETILKQELEGTSFSSEVEHQTRIEARLAAKRDPFEGPKRSRANPLKPLTRSKALAAPFEASTGRTILDKFMTFFLRLLKSLERLLVRSSKRFFIPKRMQQRMQRLQELKEKEEQARKEKTDKAKAAPGRGGASMG